MKVKLSHKYLPITFEDQKLDKWSRLTQGIRSTAEYIKKFDEFLTRCNKFVDESPIITLSRFRLAFVMISVGNSLQEVLVI